MSSVYGADCGVPAGMVTANDRTSTAGVLTWA